jgi:hypothetical protein
VHVIGESRELDLVGQGILPFTNMPVCEMKRARADCCTGLDENACTDRYQGSPFQWQCLHANMCSWLYLDSFL